MNEPRSPLHDEVYDQPFLHEQVGDTGEDDRRVRRQCLEQALTMTKEFHVEGRLAETLFAARRFASFVIEGRVPRIHVNKAAFDAASSEVAQ